MSNRLAEMEATLTRLKTRRLSRHGQRPMPGDEPAPTPDAGSPSPRAGIDRGRALALRVSRTRGLRPVRRRPRVRALTAVDTAVPGAVPAMAQPTGMSCWATVYTMLASWKQDQSLTIDDALAEIGQRWVDVYTADTGLLSADKVDFVAQAGLVAEPPQNFGIQDWEYLLRTYGPIWVTTDEAPGLPWAIHARVITAIRGDGTPGNTRLTIIDPAGGRTYRETFAVFWPKYEEEVRRTGHTRIQVLHWPQDARVTGAKSLARRWSRARSNGTRDDRDWYLPEDDGGTDTSVQAASWVFQAGAAKDSAWADDADNPDTQHLREPGMSQAFQLTGDVLARLATLNRFRLDGGQDEVLFGLRGCRMVDPLVNAFAASVQLSEDMPDHDGYHCVLGVWKRSTGQVAVFPGSTVPNWHHMNKQKTRGGQRANLLLTGRYFYTVGDHHGEHKTILGAFRQQPDVVVLRSHDDLIYERGDDFERHSPADNIHPGLSPTYGAKFSSAGCQTVPGGYDGGTQTHTGKWAEFRRAAGLSSSVTSKLGDRFVYLLLSGREARLAADGAGDELLVRLRFGSFGTDVEALQQGLQNEGHYSGTIHGDMDMNTVWAWIRRQQRSGGAADGIVTPAGGRELGFDMIAGFSVPPAADAPAAGAQSWHPTALQTAELSAEETKTLNDIESATKAFGTLFKGVRLLAMRQHDHYKEFKPLFFAWVNSAKDVYVNLEDYESWVKDQSALYALGLAAILLRHEAIHVEQFKRAGGRHPGTFKKMVEYELEAYGCNKGSWMGQWLANKGGAEHFLKHTIKTDDIETKDVLDLVRTQFDDSCQTLSGVNKLKLPKSCAGKLEDLIRDVLKITRGLPKKLKVQGENYKIADLYKTKPIPIP